MCRSQSSTARGPFGRPRHLCHWLVEYEGVTVECLPVDSYGRVHPEVPREAIARNHATLGGDPVDRLPANAHFMFPGCEGDSLLLLLDAQGIECSTGSACTAGVAQPSHVLLATGTDPELARGTLRFSLGHTSTEADVEAVAKAIAPAVERARVARLT